MEIGNLNIPENPGVYLMKKNHKVIYVGKAKNLKKRVSSYFNREHSDEKTKELIKNVEDIEFLICNSEVDALLLENNLIKAYIPKYNILLKDEKTYPYLKLTKEKFPAIHSIRTSKTLNLEKGEYFGPYPYGAWKLKKNIIKLFKIRDCNRDMNKVYQRPCLRYYMKTCLGPCIYKDVLEEYSLLVGEAREFLKGNTKKLLIDLKSKMNIASEEMDFEKAIAYREQIKELEYLKDDQIVEYGKDLDEDIFSFKIEGDKVFICVLNVRNGKILGKISTNLDLKNKIYDDILDATILSFYTKYPIPTSIVFPTEIEKDSLNIREAIIKYKNSKVEFHFPKIKSRRRELLDMATTNLNKDISNYYLKKNVVEDGIKELHDTLSLRRYPIKIECFDISNIQGKDAVASMSVSIEGKAAKKEYRKFKIHCKDTPDDFEMMREVIRRRYSKLESKDFPDVILIDGGLGQINSAGEVLEKLGKSNISDLLSLAKRDEEVYKYGESIPYKFSKDSEALKIFQRVRDEAHRFGISYHRKLRSKRVISSELDRITGIGKKRRTDLLKAFGSVKKISEASIDEISKIVPRKIAEEIKEKLGGQ